MSKGAIFLQLFEKSSLILVLFIIITKIKGVKYILQKETYNLKDLLIISLIFTGLAILGTYNGIDIKGFIVNTRIVAIVSGGVLFGPIVGIISGIVSGFYRYVIDIGGITAFPCLVASILSGVLSSLIYKKVDIKYKFIYGIVCGIISETISMILIYLLSSPQDIAIEIIKKIYIPMIIVQIVTGILISIVNEIKKERDEIAARQSKLALDIANKTLPYFRSINKESLEKICTIIKDEIKSDAVSITDKNEILAYVGVGKEFYKFSHTEISEVTKSSIKENKILNIQVSKDENSISKKIGLKTAMIIPLTDSKGVVGTLKIYYTKKYKMSHSQKSLAIGLSQIISTLMEISNIEKIENEKKKSEIKALQSQINPHFLFNALNTITSFIRINPDKARNLIINLSTYMRYNLEVSDNLININKELEQVKAYVEIEKARFGDKLNVLYDIDENINAKIPSLTIQPLVENAIIHGIRKNGGCGTVIIGVKKANKYTKVWVENNGISIDLKVIERMYSGDMPANKIGLYNVHLRLKLIYGKGLNIFVLNPGTRIEFYI